MVQSVSKAGHKFQKLVTERGLIEAFQIVGRSALQRLIKILLRIGGTATDKIVVQNGVAVRQKALLTPNVYPNHELDLIIAMRDYLAPAQEVVLIGGGRGASTVVACHCVTKAGHVTTFEASSTSIPSINDTIDLNCVSDYVTVIHGIVGDGIAITGEAGNARIVSPTDLPQCDALVMDCEGAEVGILDEMTIMPDLIIVEIHPHFDATQQRVSDILDRKGYTIDRVVDIRKVGVPILVAMRSKESVS